MKPQIVVKYTLLPQLALLYHAVTFCVVLAVLFSCYLEEPEERGEVGGMDEEGREGRMERRERGEQKRGWNEGEKKKR